MIRSRLALGLVLGLGAGACSDPQQIVLSVDTTAGIPCEIDAIRMTGRAGKTVTEERALAGARLPITFTLEDGTDDGSFDLEIVGLKDGVEVLRAAGPLQFGIGGTLAAEVVLESACTADAPCALPPLKPYVAPAPAVAARAECGEVVKRYVPGPTAETFRDVCTVPGDRAGRVLTGGARGAAALPLPTGALEAFAFRFYGRPVRQIWAHEDGYISFTTDNPDPGNDLNPGAFDRDLIGAGVPPPRQSVFPFWDTLTLGDQGVCYALEGTPGTQKLRVTWNRTCHTTTCTADNLSFTIVLDERTNRVAFTYGDMISTPPERAQGSTATSGIVDAAQGCPVASCTAATGLCADGTTPCGYTQLFSNAVQTPRVENVQFDPVVE